MYHCTEVRFASLLSGGFPRMAVINQPEIKLANGTSVHCVKGCNASHLSILAFLESQLQATLSTVVHFTNRVGNKNVLSKIAN